MVYLLRAPPIRPPTEISIMPPIPINAKKPASPVPTIPPATAPATPPTAPPVSTKRPASIKAIIEIEDSSRKHMVGGVITADYCMGKRKQHPDMFIIALDEQNKKDYRKRLPMFKKYKKHLKNITIDNKLEITKKLREL